MERQKININNICWPFSLLFLFCTVCKKHIYKIFIPLIDPVIMLKHYKGRIPGFLLPCDMGPLLLGEHVPGAVHAHCACNTERRKNKREETGGHCQTLSWNGEGAADKATREKRLGLSQHIIFPPSEIKKSYLYVALGLEPGALWLSWVAPAAGIAFLADPSSSRSFPWESPCPVR